MNDWSDDRKKKHSETMKASHKHRKWLDGMTRFARRRRKLLATLPRITEKED